MSTCLKAVIPSLLVNMHTVLSHLLFWDALLKFFEERVCWIPNANRLCLPSSSLENDFPRGVIFH